MCVCVVCHLLFTFFLLTCSTPLWWEDLVRAPFVSHQNFVDLHLRSNFFFFFQVYVRHKPLFFFAWNFSDLVWSLGALQEGKIDSYRTVSIVCWLAWKNPVANDLIDYANRVFNHVLLFPPFFLKDYQLPMLPPTPDVATRDTLVLDCLIQQVSRIDSDLPPILYF